MQLNVQLKILLLVKRRSLKSIVQVSIFEARILKKRTKSKVNEIRQTRAKINKMKTEKQKRLMKSKLVLEKNKKVDKSTVLLLEHENKSTTY